MKRSVIYSDEHGIPMCGGDMVRMSYDPHTHVCCGKAIYNKVRENECCGQRYIKAGENIYVL